MLTSQQAEEQLARFKVAGDESRLVADARKLPDKLWKLAADLWDLEGDLPPYPSAYQEHQQRWLRARAALSSLSAKDRGKLFGAVSPLLAPHLEATWDLIDTTPYQCGWRRKAFRAPGHATATLEKRCTWLRMIGGMAAPYPADLLTPSWVATWAAHLSYGSGEVAGLLLAAVMNHSTAEADEVFEILSQSLLGQHPIGAMGRHVIRAMLLSGRQQGWELIEKTLLAAQRQEGLRQAILECIDECHPEAFRRMLRLILDHDLLRFAAAVRATNVWFGQMWSAAAGGFLKQTLTQVLGFLEEPKATSKALAGKDPHSAFLALWRLAYDDAAASIPAAVRLLSSKNVEMRYVAARHLENLGLDEALEALEPAIDDDDLRVAFVAAENAPRGDTQNGPGSSESRDGRFERIERLIERTPKKKTQLEPLVWPWEGRQIERPLAASFLLDARGDRPASRIIRHFENMDADTRRRAIASIVESTPWDAATRQAVLDLAGDPSSGVRSAALEALAKTPRAALTPSERQQLESYLERKASDLRRGVLDLLRQQPDEAAIASCERLLARKDGAARLAGLELLRLLVGENRRPADCRQMAEAYSRSRNKLTRDEQGHLAEIREVKPAVASLDDALGLMNPADRTPVVAPRRLKVAFFTPACEACLLSLDELVHQHREATVEISGGAGEVRQELLGNLSWHFPRPARGKKRATQEKLLPLADVWLDWLRNRESALKDDDGLELVRASVWLQGCDRWTFEHWTRWVKGRNDRAQVLAAVTAGLQSLDLRYERVVSALLDWLLYLAPVDSRDYLLDAVETLWSLVPQADMQKLAPGEPRLYSGAHDWMNNDEVDWRTTPLFNLWDTPLDDPARVAGQDFTEEQRRRRWRLLHWRDEPFPGAERRRPPVEEMLDAYLLGEANLADLADHLLGARGSGGNGRERFDLLKLLTSRRTTSERVVAAMSRPEVQELLGRAVQRIFEMETARGDAPTVVSAPCYALGTLWGAPRLLRVLEALGESEFKLSSVWRSGDTLDRRESLTHLARISQPAPEDACDEVVAAMRAAVKQKAFPEIRLLQLTFLAPQWTRFIEAYFGWPHLAEALYWFLAHMQIWAGDSLAAAALAGGEEDDNDAKAASDRPSEASQEGGESEPQDGQPEEAPGEDSEAPPRAPAKKLSAWEKLMLERTPLTSEERREGAIDVGWFRRTHALLGPDKWEKIASAARFAATPAQARHARYIGEVLLGNVKRQELIDGIQKRQLKENVRLLGLLPLEKGKKRAADLAERCRILRDYRRYANSLSGLTRPAALRAWEIGMKNLAQTAGYADPLRLEWAVGAEAVSDLAEGPVSVSQSGVSLSLSLDDQAQPSLVARRDGKEIKSLPAALKKDKNFAALRERFVDIKRQASSVRAALEAATCRGDPFSGEELRSWSQHALLSPLLSRLVVVGEGVLGYPDKQGRALRDHRGKLEPVKPQEQLRLAHPHDLLLSGEWHLWQRDCFQAERVQPFKQVFRELYVPTPQEQDRSLVSRRYSGQQVQPRQTVALLAGRGWNTGDGLFKVFHEERIVVEIFGPYVVGTPAEAEDWTIEGVAFRKKERSERLLLQDVPPRLFSEAMRDLDLVVSVAHAGGVAPEASESTVEMRASLVRETCQLLSLENVRIKSHHVLIDGQLANYSVHLGSGTVHKMPGGAVCIVPVHAQHRGRLFLPFADDDPKTAEIVSKTLLLASDHQIQDPSILEQLRR